MILSKLHSFDQPQQQQQQSSTDALSSFRNNRSISQSSSRNSPIIHTHKAHYVNQHTQDNRKFFSLKRSDNQPGRHFSPELQHLEQPITRDGVCMNKLQILRLRDLTKEIHTTKRFQQGSFNSNYSKQIQYAKDKLFERESNHMRIGKHGIAGLHLEPLAHKNSGVEGINTTDYTHKPKVFNRQGLLLQQHHSDSKAPTCFNLDMHQWTAQQQKELNTSQFQLLSPDVSNVQQPSTIRRRRKVSNQLSIDQNESHASIGTSPFSEDMQQQSYFIEPPISLKKHTPIKQQLSQQSPFLSPLIQNKSIRSSPIKQYSSNKKQTKNSQTSSSVAGGADQNSPRKHLAPISEKDNVNDFGLYRSNKLSVPTPLIYKAIDILESQNMTGHPQDPLQHGGGKGGGLNTFRIDEGFGDHILKYHHIKTRVQDNLIPSRVLIQPELLPMLTSYSQLPPEDNNTDEGD